jgi:hypothetical protein
MAYDEGLAARVREVLGEREPAFEERKMFGGLAFVTRAGMPCGCVGDDLLVRVGRAGFAAAMEAGAREMDMTGRVMRSMAVVPAGLVATDDALATWVETGIAALHTDPPGARRKRRARPPAGPA